jgi:hypothetical protein
MMKRVFVLLGILFLAAPFISYFRYQRQVDAANSSGQHYAVADQSLFQHARQDLADIRIYSTGNEVPYVIMTESGGTRVEQKDLRILQPGVVAGKTQFILDLSGIPEYNRVELKLAIRNFVAHARIEGQNDPHATQWTLLGTSTLYDLSDEKLGRSSVLQIPVSTFQFLRVTVDSSIKPADIQGATAGATLTQKVAWHDVSTAPNPQQNGKDTEVTFTLLENVPVERVSFTFDPSQQNFRRDVEIQDEKGQQVASGELSRVHMKRNGQSIDSDQTTLDFSETGPHNLKVIIHNGDDVPLKIADARLQQYERRIYFDSDAAAQLILYYGDHKLDAPVYDYAKLFESDPNAAQVQLGAEQLNSAFTGRPDDRPWSERHPALLWIAIVAAVLILGSLALRSMKPQS